MVDIRALLPFILSSLPPMLLPSLPAPPPSFPLFLPSLMWYNSINNCIFSLIQVVFKTKSAMSTDDNIL